nr:dockerin type I repeat-containing protein [candidate division Zixibacteria bacterium]
MTMRVPMLVLGLTLVMCLALPAWGNTAGTLPSVDDQGNVPQSLNSGKEDCTWAPGDPHKMHDPQLPDEAGWDVNATQPVILADDWMCSETGWVKDFHFWGSWKHGVTGNILSFVLSIHSDIPADQSPTGYSMPGLTLWEMEATEFNITPIDPPTMEGWYDPSTGEILPDDHQNYFQYDICFDEQYWFWQEEGTIYWFNISAVLADGQTTQWGWKSSLDHWNDDAVWAFWGALNWQEIYEPELVDTLVNDFMIAIDPLGNFMGGGGAGAYDDGTSINGTGWYFYPQYEWYNIWFYDHPFDTSRYKTVRLEFDVFPMDPGQPGYFEIAVNWSTDAWSIEQLPGDSAPPLPGVLPEELYIGRATVFAGELYEGHYIFEYVIDAYNPEWVSVDVRGYNFNIPFGLITHICQPKRLQSLDLSFVVTGGPPETGACCFPDGLCADLIEIDCVNQGGAYQGDGSACLGDYSPANGIDDACETGPFGACCFTDGSCIVYSQADCFARGGDYRGDGTICLGDANGNQIDDACEDVMSACCFSDGSCADLIEVDCLSAGGTFMGVGTHCLGDNNNNGVNDACEGWNPEQGHKMHYPQLPNPVGWAVDATYPQVLADDWMCSETGWVKDIHFWGSYQNAWGAPQYGTVERFILSIHADVPAGIDQPYSHPGELLWQIESDQFSVIPYSDVIVPEGWYDPYLQLFVFEDHFNLYQYNFYLDSLDWFHQDSGTIYWLNISAVMSAGVEPSGWGWKSTLDHWNDDAVWGLHQGQFCTAPDNGFGTIDLPALCPFLPLHEKMHIIDGLPPGTTIECDPEIRDFFNIVVTPGGTLGGEILQFDANLHLEMAGTGTLAGYTRSITMPVEIEIHTGPRVPGDPIQIFPWELMSMTGSIVGDPDFDLLQITAGTANGLPCPGEVKLTENKGDGTYWVESFFDITYRIDFIGAPGSMLDGYAGSTTATIRMFQGAAVNFWIEMYEPPDFFQSLDLSFVITGEPDFVCDCRPGDANGSGTYNILDVTYLINYLYKSGPAPTPYPICSGDANCNCAVNILDATYLISYLYKSGTPPCTCEQWLINCGPPLRK